MKLPALSDETRRMQIVAALRDRIVSGAVEPGARLTEAELSAQLGVSRAPLREAIRELVACGLLVSQPYRGLYVRSFSARELRELYSLRLTLERMAFRECWDRRDPSALDDLDARHAALQARLEAGDRGGAIAAELHLHGWCFELAHHTLLMDAWRRIQPNIQFYFAQHLRAHDRIGLRDEMHRRYVECARGDDQEAMLAHLDIHLRQGLDGTLRAIAEQPKKPGAKPAQAGQPAGTPPEQPTQKSGRLS